jgi:hypothetical protein
MSRPVLKLVDPGGGPEVDQEPPSLELRDVFRAHSAYVATLA